MYRVIEVHNRGPITVWQDPQELDPFEGLVEWEDIVDDYGEPEMIGPGIWIVRWERDKPHLGIKHGDPIVMIICVPR